MHDQQGWSLTGLLLWVALAGFVFFTALKLYPVYYEGFKVKGAVQNLKNETGIATINRYHLWRALEKRLDINGVTSVKREHLVIDKLKNGDRNIGVRYERRIHYFYNIDFVLTFDPLIQVAGG